MTDLSTEPRPDIWAKIRIPSRRSMMMVADAVLKQNGWNPAWVRCNGKRPSVAQIGARNAMLAALHEAGFRPAAISGWFSHRDYSIVRSWMEELGLINAL